MPPHPILIHRAALLRARRKERGLTLAQVAEGVGVAIPTVSRWETGAIDPTIENKLAVAALLEVDPAELFPFRAPV